MAFVDLGEVQKIYVELSMKVKRLEGELKEALEENERLKKIIESNNSKEKAK